MFHTAGLDKVWAYMLPKASTSPFPKLSVQLPVCFALPIFRVWVTGYITLITKLKGINDQLSKWSSKSYLFLPPAPRQRLQESQKLLSTWESLAGNSPPAFKCGVYFLWVSNNPSISTAFCIHIALCNSRNIVMFTFVWSYNNVSKIT